MHSNYTKSTRGRGGEEEGELTGAGEWGAGRMSGTRYGWGRGGVGAAGQRRGGGALRNHDENAIHTKEYHIQELQKLNKVRPTLSILSSWQNIIYKHEFCSHLYSNKYLYTHIVALSILHLEEDLLLHPTQLNNLVEL